MKRGINNKIGAEELLIFAGLIKWIALASGVGIIVGFSTTIFLKVLSWASAYSNQTHYYFIFVPVWIFLSSILIKYIASGAEGHGTEKVIQAIHKEHGRMPIAVVPVKLVASIVTIAGGGSVGKEGPCAQIGAGLASFMAKALRFKDEDRKKLVICGISAAFASVFGTPIAGAIFGLEVLVIGSLMYEVLFPSFISGIVSFQVSKALGIRYFYNPLKLTSFIDEIMLIKVIVGGIFFGLVALMFIEALNIGREISEHLKLWQPMKGLIGGIIIIILTLLTSPDYLGLGIEKIQSALEGTEIIWYAFIMKIILTSVTLNFGGSGGVITPLFFVGSVAGNLFGRLLNISPATFSAIGFVSVLAGAANTPIAASIMAVELFGSEVAPYATIACIISFMMSGHRSVYPSQVIALSKSPYMTTDIGEDVEKADIYLRLTKSWLLRIIIWLKHHI